MLQGQCASFNSPGSEYYDALCAAPSPDAALLSSVYHCVDSTSPNENLDAFNINSAFLSPALTTVWGACLCSVRAPQSRERPACITAHPECSKCEFCFSPCKHHSLTSILLALPTSCSTLQMLSVGATQAAHGTTATRALSTLEQTPFRTASWQQPRCWSLQMATIATLTSLQPRTAALCSTTPTLWPRFFQSHLHMAAPTTQVCIGLIVATAPYVVTFHSGHGILDLLPCGQHCKHLHMNTWLPNRRQHVDVHF